MITGLKLHGALHCELEQDNLSSAIGSTKDDRKSNRNG